jgi:hypothetical protein
VLCPACTAFELWLRSNTARVRVDTTDHGLVEELHEKPFTFEDVLYLVLILWCVWLSSFNRVASNAGECKRRRVNGLVSLTGRNKRTTGMQQGLGVAEAKRILSSSTGTRT